MFRQIATILLLCLFVFNIIGYRLIVTFSIAKADTALQLSLDNKTYNQADLFLVKIPINLPYQNNWANFERVDGEVNFENETYRFVQRKVENDTMYLQCIRHAEKTIIQQKANDFFGKTTDIANNNNSKKSSSNQSTAIKYMVEDFVDNDDQWQALRFINTINYCSNHNNSNGSSHLQHIIKPPQA